MRVIVCVVAAFGLMVLFGLTGQDGINTQRVQNIQSVEAQDIKDAELQIAMIRPNSNSIRLRRWLTERSDHIKLSIESQIRRVYVPVTDSYILFMPEDKTTRLFVYTYDGSYLDVLWDDEYSDDRYDEVTNMIVGLGLFDEELYQEQVANKLKEEEEHRRQTLKPLMDYYEENIAGKAHSKPSLDWGDWEFGVIVVSTSWASAIDPIKAMVDNEAMRDEIDAALPSRRVFFLDGDYGAGPALNHLSEDISTRWINAIPKDKSMPYLFISNGVEVLWHGEYKHGEFSSVMETVREMGLPNN